jgi:hypothetical protein
MPRAIQQLNGFFTGGAAGTGVATPMTGDTFTVPSVAPGSAAVLEQAWATGALVDFVRVRSPRMHDANQGIRIRVDGTTQVPLLPWGLDQPMYALDTPVVEIDVTAAGTGAIGVLYEYDDLPGVSQRLATWEEVDPRIINLMGCDVSLGAIGAIGAYSAGNALNSLFDNFEAGYDYALLGYEVSAARHAISVAGPDTSFMKVGGPGSVLPNVTSDYFQRVARITGRPFIPIIAANNKQSTLVFQTDNAASAAVNVSLLLAQLRG